ncbi:MAG TPA: hypothetical protein VMZ90_12080 [Vicinamibacterales bacterium]|nr:hypothetical protein [Vicinamibacterales bacterium]
MMQAVADIQVPPAVPAAPAIPGVTTVSTGVLTSRDVAAMRARGQELSDQLSSVVSRRRSIIEKLKNTTADDRPGLEQRLGVLDKRIVQLESDIQENGKALASLPAALASTQARPARGGGFSPSDRLVNNMVPMVVVFTLFVLCPIALSISRYFWKRGSAPRHAPAENAQRLERMEQAIDSIAIEIERVSEGQRFVTRLLAEQRSPALAEGQPGADAVPAQNAGARRY